MTRKEGRLVEGGRPNKGREWTRPEAGGGGEPRRPNNREGGKNGDPAPRTSSRLHSPFGGNFAGEGGPAKKSHGARIAAAPARGPVLGDPQDGEAGAGRSGRGERPVTEGRSEPPGAAETRGQRHLGPGRRAVPRGRGRHSSRAPSTTTPSPSASPHHAPQDRPSRRRLGRPPTGPPSARPGPGLPAPPAPQPPA